MTGPVGGSGALPRPPRSGGSSGAPALRPPELPAAILPRRGCLLRARPTSRRTLPTASVSAALPMPPGPSSWTVFAEVMAQFTGPRSGGPIQVMRATSIGWPAVSTSLRRCAWAHRRTASSTVSGRVTPLPHLRRPAATGYGGPPPRRLSPPKRLPPASSCTHSGTCTGPRTTLPSVAAPARPRSGTRCLRLPPPASCLPCTARRTTSPSAAALARQCPAQRRTRLPPHATARARYSPRHLAETAPFCFTCQRLRKESGDTLVSAMMVTRATNGVAFAASRNRGCPHLPLPAAFRTAACPARQRPQPRSRSDSLAETVRAPPRP